MRSTRHSAVSVSARVLIPRSGLDLRTAEDSAPGEVLQVSRPSPEPLSGTVGRAWDWCGDRGVGPPPSHIPSSVTLVELGRVTD